MLKCQETCARDLSPNTPVIDFSLLSSGDEGERTRINPPAKEWNSIDITRKRKRRRRENYFQMLIAKFASIEQIIYHGVAEDILRRIKTAMAGFSNLWYEERRKYAMAPNDVQLRIWAKIWSVRRAETGLEQPPIYDGTTYRRMTNEVLAANRQLLVSIWSMIRTMTH